MTDLPTEAQVARVRSYCAELCRAELVKDAVAAALTDFLARVEMDDAARTDVDELVAKAARSGASSRVEVGAGNPTPPTPKCAAMPELLAARANNELPGDDRLIRQHLSECIVCETTFARFRRAEQYLSASFVVPAPEPTIEAEAPMPAEVSLEPAPLAPEPEPEPSGDEPETVAEEAPAEQPVAEEPAAEEPAAEEPAAEEPVAEEPEPLLEPAPLAQEEPEPAAQKEPEPAAEEEPEPAAEEEPEPVPPEAPPEPPPPPPPPPTVVVKRRRGGLVAAIGKVARNAMR